MNHNLLYILCRILPQRYGSVGTPGIRHHLLLCVMIQRQIYFTTPGSSIHNHFILNKMELMFTILIDYQCHIEIVESHPDTQYISRVCLDALLELVDRLGNDRKNTAQGIQHRTGSSIGSYLRSIITDDTYRSVCLYFRLCLVLHYRQGFPFIRHNRPQIAVSPRKGSQELQLHGRIMIIIIATTSQQTGQQRQKPPITVLLHVFILL